MLRDKVQAGELTEEEASQIAGVQMWPTPTGSDWRGSGPTIRRKDGKMRGDRLDYAVEQFATPQARDFRTGEKKRWENPDKSRNLNDQIGGQLNPTWVEWLMGYPLGWTDLNA
jgi:hypothetical protein